MSTNKTGVAALIATADRGPSIVMTIESIKRLQGQLDELVIVDQSSNDDTYMAIMPYLQDPFISYMRVSSKGKGKALPSPRTNGQRACSSDR
jgi:glycosyltransferase involved in cell wall biosynthesis